MGEQPRDGDTFVGVSLEKAHMFGWDAEALYLRRTFWGGYKVVTRETGFGLSRESALDTLRRVMTLYRNPTKEDLAPDYQVIPAKDFPL